METGKYLKALIGLTLLVGIITSCGGESVTSTGSSMVGSF